MPNSIARILESRVLWFIARLLILVLFLSSGFAKVFDYENSLAEMRAAGLNPDWFFNIATAVVLFSGSLLVLFDRYLWLGAGALAVFLFLTIVVVHTFWNMTGDKAMLSMYFAIEHTSVIGGLMAMAMASYFRTLWKKLTHKS
ncbi:MAG TPA: DoxX family protein [Proteus vulgaris]|jgi:transmembrane protein|uniref:DoxX family protein n=1 Tax=Proteus TaxID=583 RepID=UPI000ED8857B|nr:MULTISPECIES: DoxX family protein [Proteus]AYY82083.1 DoxX family protein [Proteus vulgaris]MCH4255894.1 DoxX family protein [Proteus vulgaris]MDM3561183.1 DoxX family protein [Proteus vulgaris]MDM3564627.1 DoxX family protein [Proteus vulgaris]NBN86101.1 DoxX family membrane protein [Proteus sp. G2300]